MVEIEVVVGHFGGQHHKGLPLALFMQLLRLFKGNEGVLLAMHYECGAVDLWHQFEVVEVLCHQEAQEAYLVLDNVLYRSVGRHQDESAWIVVCRDVGGWPTAHRPPEEQDVLLAHAHRLLQYVLVDIQCVPRDLL
jgi:hypothetical protein